MTTVALGDICSVRSSLVNPTLDQFRSLPHVPPDAIERDTGRLLPHRTAEADGVTSGKYRFQPGDVLYSKIRPNLNKVIRVDFEGLCSADMYALDVDSGRARAEFVVYVLRSQAFLDYAASLSNRANIPKLNRDQLMRFELELPSLRQQRRIAAILDQADAIRAKRRQMLAQLETLGPAIFRSMFGDPIENPHQYAIRPLADWIEPGRPITYGILKPGPEIDGGIPYIRVADMKQGGVNTRTVRRTSPEISHAYRRSLLRTGDLLMSIRGHVGRFAHIPSELDAANITQDSARLSIQQPAASAYVRGAMEADGIQRWMVRRTKGVAVKGLNIGDLRRVPIPVPSESLQVEFAGRLQAAIRQQAAVRTSLVAADELFASLQSRAFRGQL